MQFTNRIRAHAVPYDKVHAVAAEAAAPAAAPAAALAADPWIRGSIFFIMKHIFHDAMKSMSVTSTLLV